jgi:tRNA-splicing ligase RtcB (3'-phosphate/5'-hydroxy nucleic acid ligase)
MNVMQTGKIQYWLPEQKLATDVQRVLDRLAQQDDVERIAVMPDVHLAGDVCNGTAMATREMLYPAAVGNDIGCGMAAVRFFADAPCLHDDLNATRLLSALHRLVPTNRHSSTTMPESLPEQLLQDRLSDERLEKLKSRDARVQFGTLGRGNHFVEFQVDTEQHIWVMVHTGSRAIGQAIASHHLERSEPQASALVAFDANSVQGRDYLHDATWAIEYARQNRLAILGSLAGFLYDALGMDADWSSLIHSDHNHVRREQHGGQDWWVHRKGAQSAFAGEPGVIPGSMGTASFHVEGRGNEESLCSSSHGAGRRLSRQAARRSIRPRALQRQLQNVWFDPRKAAALCDEAPSAYKDIHAVMRSQRKLTRIVRELSPVLSYKGA